MFPFLIMLTLGIIIFILVPKQPSFGTLVLLDFREDSPGTPRSSLNLRFDQCSYPLFSWDIRLRPGRGYAMSLALTTFAPYHLCFLEDLSVTPCVLFPRMPSNVVDSAHDVSYN